MYGTSRPAYVAATHTRHEPPRGQGRPRCLQQRTPRPPALRLSNPLRWVRPPSGGRPRASAASLTNTPAGSKQRMCRGLRAIRTCRPPVDRSHAQTVASSVGLDRRPTTDKGLAQTSSAAEQSLSRSCSAPDVTVRPLQSALPPPRPPTPSTSAPDFAARAGAMPTALSSRTE